MLKFIPPLLLAALLTTGCGGGESSAPQTQTSASVATSASTPDMVAKAESLAQVVVGGSTTDFVVDDGAAVTTEVGSDSRQNASVARNAVSQVVAVGLGQLGVLVSGETAASPANRIGNQDVSRLVTSPLGGTVQVDIVGSTLTAVFHDLKTRRATLNGTCRLSLVSGRLSSGTYQIAVNFSAVSIATQAGTFNLEGAADLNRTRTLSATNLGLDSVWKSNLKISDVGGGSRTFQNFLTTSHIDLAAGALSATQSYAGTLIVENLQGLSGTFQISTPTPVRFAGSQQAFQVQAGQLLIAGVGGTLRLTVSATNQIEIAVVSGGGAVTVVRTVSWTSLGGWASTD